MSKAIDRCLLRSAPLDEFPFEAIWCSSVVLYTWKPHWSATAVRHRRTWEQAAGHPSFTVGSRHRVPSCFCSESAENDLFSKDVRGYFFCNHPFLHPDLDLQLEATRIFRKAKLS